jgi:hypothetical protein
MARICVDEDDFTVDSGGVLHLSDRVGSQQLLTFTTVGNFTFNPAAFPGLKAVRVVAVGGGGGGAGANASAGEAIVRAGGSGGGYSESVFNVADLVGVQGITVGAGGAGGDGNEPGNDGNASSFGGSLVVAPGGKGSVVSQTSGTGAAGVTGTGGPTAGTGQIRMGGGVGHGAIRLDANSGLSGAGGDSGGGLGTGGGARASEGGAYGPRGFGSGGAGAFSIGANQVGGQANNGAVFLYLQF